MQAGLFHKLQEAGISGQALNFIRQWYDNSMCSVLWNGQPSRTISINLPDISTLAANPHSTGIWHRCVNRLISCQAQLNLNEEAESKRDLDPLIQCCTKPNAPAPHWKVTHSAEMLHLTTRSNFRVRLLLGCHGLECDATRFRVRRDGGPTGNTCKLCHSGKIQSTSLLPAMPCRHGVDLCSVTPRSTYLIRSMIHQRLRR